MKRFIIFIFVFMFSFCVLDVYASDKYQVRTEDDYGVPSYVHVTDSNKEAVLSTPLVDSSEKIYDFAGKFSSSEEKRLYKLVSKYIDTYNMDMVIVTINDNPKESATACGQDFYDYNTFGISDSHDGILLLYDFYYNRVSIVTTGKANRMYGSSRIKALKKVIADNIKTGYYEAAVSFIGQASSFSELGYPTITGAEPKRTGVKLLKVLPWPGIISFSIATTAILVILIIKNKKVVVGKLTYRKYLNYKKFKSEIIEDTFINKTLDKNNRI
jgi:uncharacterized membrane protein YgcG